jgi:hypothetical protein
MLPRRQVVFSGVFPAETIFGCVLVEKFIFGQLTSLS